VSRALPESSDIAGFCAMLFIKLGGTFAVGSNGVRYAGRPEPVLFRLQEKGLAQLPEPEPHERFHSSDEWRGAIKLLDYCLARMSQADQDFIYAAFASVAVDDRKPLDFREHLR
jgi:hypothetical protein